MRDPYRFKITCDYRYYGAPQAKRKYTISNEYLTAKVDWYGNQGTDAIQITKKGTNNGCFWAMHNLMAAIYGENRLLSSPIVSDIKEGESKLITIGRDDSNFYKIITQ